MIAIAAGIMASNISIASAQKTPREACCLEMGGTWSAGGNGSLYCYNLGRGRSDSFYKCVENKTFGKKSKKN